MADLTKEFGGIWLDSVGLGHTMDINRSTLKFIAMDIPEHFQFSSTRISKHSTRNENKTRSRNSVTHNETHNLLVPRVDPSTTQYALIHKSLLRAKHGATAGPASFASLTISHSPFTTVKQLLTQNRNANGNSK